MRKYHVTFKGYAGSDEIAVQHESHITADTMVGAVGEANLLRGWWDKRQAHREPLPPLSWHRIDDPAGPTIPAERVDYLTVRITEIREI